jgi:hypothetical protein
MADGTTKKIINVQEGDKVFNHDKSAINTVTFTEYDVDNTYHALYSPSNKFKPFATINHPLIIDGELYAVNPTNNYEVYPWLGKNKLLTPDTVIPASGQRVYSLWLDGDNTFRVNGYGTHSIFGDGDGLLDAYRRGKLTKEEVLETRRRFVNNGNNAIYGGYLYNKFLGWVKINSLTDISADLFKDNSKPIIQSISMSLLKLLGLIAKPILKITQIKGIKK